MLRLESKRGRETGSNDLYTRRVKKSGPNEQRANSVGKPGGKAMLKEGPESRCFPGACSRTPFGKGLRKGCRT